MTLRTRPVRRTGRLGRTGKRESTASPQPRKKERTREALIATSLQLIAKKGIEATSVVEITETLGISNGAFYYHFENMDRLLEEVGHTVVISLGDRIENVDQPDPAHRIARGPLIVLAFVDRHPELRAIMLRVIEDPEGLHAELHERLRDDVLAGKRISRFAVHDVEVAVRFGRAIIGSAVRLRHEGYDAVELGAITAVRTLAMLGLPTWEASLVVEREQASIAREEQHLADLSDAWPAFANVDAVLS